MNLKTYSKHVRDLTAVIDNGFMDKIHMLLGMATEVGELQDQFKKHIAYGRKLDIVNIEEELGDILFYISGMCNCLDISVERILDQNIAKLRARYPDKFTEQLANNRDLVGERKVLEGYSQMELVTEPE